MSQLHGLFDDVFASALRQVDLLHHLLCQRYDAVCTYCASPHPAADAALNQEV